MGAALLLLTSIISVLTLSSTMTTERSPRQFVSPLPPYPNYPYSGISWGLEPYKYRPSGPHYNHDVLYTSPAPQLPAGLHPIFGFNQWFPHVSIPSISLPFPTTPPPRRKTTPLPYHHYDPHSTTYMIPLNEHETTTSSYDKYPSHTTHRPYTTRKPSQKPYYEHVSRRPHHTTYKPHYSEYTTSKPQNHYQYKPQNGHGNPHGTRKPQHNTPKPYNNEPYQYEHVTHKPLQYEHETHRPHPEYTTKTPNNVVHKPHHVTTPRPYYSHAQNFHNRPQYYPGPLHGDLRRNFTNNFHGVVLSQRPQQSVSYYVTKPYGGKPIYFDIHGQPYNRYGQNYNNEYQRPNHHQLHLSPGKPENTHHTSHHETEHDTVIHFEKPEHEHEEHIIPKPDYETQNHKPDHYKPSHSNKPQNEHLKPENQHYKPYHHENEHISHQNKPSHTEDSHHDNEHTKPDSYKPDHEFDNHHEIEQKPHHHVKPSHTEKPHHENQHIKPTQSSHHKPDHEYNHEEKPEHYTTSKPVETQHHSTSHENQHKPSYTNQDQNHFSQKPENENKPVSPPHHETETQHHSTSHENQHKPSYTNENQNHFSQKPDNQNKPVNYPHHETETQHHLTSHENQHKPSYINQHQNHFSQKPENENKPVSPPHHETETQHHSNPSHHPDEDDTINHLHELLASVQHGQTPIEFTQINHPSDYDEYAKNAVPTTSNTTEAAKTEEKSSELGKNVSSSTIEKKQEVENKTESPDEADEEILGKNVSPVTDMTSDDNQEEDDDELEDLKSPDTTEPAQTQVNNPSLDESGKNAPPVNVTSEQNPETQTEVNLNERMDFSPPMSEEYFPELTSPTESNAPIADIIQRQ